MSGYRLIHDETLGFFVPRHFLETVSASERPQSVVCRIYFRPCLPPATAACLYRRPCRSWPSPSDRKASERVFVIAFVSPARSALAMVTPRSQAAVQGAAHIVCDASARDVAELKSRLARPKSGLRPSSLVEAVAFEDEGPSSNGTVGSERAWFPGTVFARACHQDIAVGLTFRCPRCKHELVSLLGPRSAMCDRQELRAAA